MNIVFRPVVEDGVHRYLPKPRKGRLPVADPFEGTAVVDKAVVESVGPESKETSNCYLLSPELKVGEEEGTNQNASVVGASTGEEAVAELSYVNPSS